MTIRGSKTWDDIQVWKFSSGATQAGSYDATGAWTFGASNTALTHTLQGNILDLNSGTSSQVITFKARHHVGGEAAFITYQNDTAQRCGFGVAGTGTPTSLVATGAASSDTFISQGTSPLDFLSGTTGQTLIGTATAAGAWTFGPTATNNYDGQRHSVRGGVYSGIVTSSDGSGGFIFGNNVRISTSNAETGRTNTTTGGSAVRVDNRLSSANEAIGFYANQPGDATSTIAANIGNATHLGAWTLGITTAANYTHEIRNNSTVSNPLTIRNYEATTASDARECLYLIKGSTTNTAGTNHFLSFQINAGGTNSGYIGTNGATNAAFFASSDRRLKKNIASLSGALDKILDMRPVTYQWKADDSNGVGFIAQELADVFPQVVAQSDDGAGAEVPEGQEPWSMTESGFVPYLVAALQELKQQFDDYVASHP